MKIGLENLTFGYRPEEVLFRISELLVSSGEAVGIVGPSGAGKTTLLRLLAGICLPISGRIVMDGTEMNSLNDAARRRFRNERIGLVFQDFRLLEYLSIRDNMLLPFRVSSVPSSAADLRSKVDALADRLELVGRIDASPGKLSQGEQQRVAIGRALISSPQLILADEPTGNLDERNKIRMRDLLVNHCRDHGVTLLMVTHDPQLLDPFDRVIDFSDYQERKGEE